ncbi:MAG TPA: DUF1294 domain-containing protein [Firmicutes bacterium]|nr:DUF1294 domain-containing protein [Bacillota bacterium]
MGLIIVLWNVYCFYMMFSDKSRAVKNQWRISEKKLLLSAFFFGGIGIWLGMVKFRHKTKHWYFQLFVPACAILQAIGLGYFFGILF